MIAQPQKPLLKLAASDFMAELEDSMILELARFHTSAGGYYKRIADFERNVEGPLDEVFDQLMGMAPAVLVRCADVVDAGSMPAKKAQRFLVTCELYFVSTTLRSHSARQRGDGVGDPGIYGMLADARALLIGRVIEPLISALILKSQGPEVRGQSEGAIWMQAWAAEVSQKRVDVAPFTPAADDIEQHHQLIESDDPPATRVTTITDEEIP